VHISFCLFALSLTIVDAHLHLHAQREKLIEKVVFV
jgi:hypothetical protein